MIQFAVLDEVEIADLVDPLLLVVLRSFRVSACLFISASHKYWSCILYCIFQSMARTPSEIQSVAVISNDITKLIPIGTLNFYGHPQNCAFLSTHLRSQSTWKWFDAEFLGCTYKDEICPVLRSLIYLCALRFLVCTYKVHHVTFLPRSEPVPVFKIRVYAVPFDVSGFRFFKLWRRKYQSEAQLTKKFKTEWFLLVNVLDFSTQGWKGCASRCTLLTFVAYLPVLILPFLAENKPLSLSFHVERYLQGQPYIPDTGSKPEKSLDQIVQRLYSRITVPDLSTYENKTVKSSEVPTSEELIVNLVRRYETNSKLIPGVKSTLYPFQLKSLCKMFEKETYLKREPVPNFVKLRSPSGTIYYFDVLGPGFYKMPELYTLPRGGILAENMGLGKTLICLSLICISKFEVATIPDNVILHPDQTLVHQKQDKIQSLSDLCRDTINQRSLPWKFYRDDLPSSVIDSLSSHPGYFRISLGHEWGSRTKERKSTNFQTLVLSNTTLIVVPENLFHQWNNELKKHVDPQYLNKLFISNRFKAPIHTVCADYVDTPPADPRDLIKYDVVIITIPLFSKMSRNDDVLRKVYWKRLIIDEGHSMTSKSSNVSMLCNSLHAERRWAVTGTPTSGLTNLYMNEEEHVQESPTKKKRKYIVKSKFSVRDDMLKIGSLVGNYFKIEPFHTQPKLWNSTMVKGLTDPDFSTETSLQNLLNSLMVRHGLVNIEQDLNLPQLHHEAVFLRPSYQNKLAINLFTAVLAVNAVSSEREGSDYMFDPANRQQLRKLVNNLQLATFYWTGFQQLDVETLVSISNHCLKKKNAAGDSAYGQEDLNLLQRSLFAANQALCNSRWRTAAQLHEMQYYIFGLPDLFVKAFGTGAFKSSAISIFGAPHLAAVQDFFYKNRFMSYGDTEKLKDKLDAASKPFWKNYWTDATKKETTKFKKQESAHDFEVQGLRERFPDSMVDPEFTISPARRSSLQNWETTRDLLTRENGDGLKVTEGIHNENSESLKEAEILGTASAKLSYLACRLVDHQREGIKSIVFFEFEDSAYYLTELLDLLGVNYILYATFIGAGQRSNNLTDFDSYNDGGITLIMDLRLAAHGLTIISATRVYFMSPVWQRSVEAQAIKRAHRIGQTKEVYVETLVLKGTLEEEIYRRREEPEPQLNAPNLRRYVIDDTGMQQFILKHEFLPMDDSELEYSLFSAPVVGDEVQIEGLTEDFDSLLSHKPIKRLSQLQWHKDWTIRLFTVENLQKLNNAKRQKPDPQQLNMELVDKKKETIPVKRSEKARRKNVRF